ncbi:MAG: TRAP transporter large permease [Proteobacteria bacterium]|nr:TRAP transporter large permease [Pseudomonadota bacterium]MBU1451900.1 TRAP transporter large permease [Pseudomonadota bacterium]MBU2469852.1 TRAP transporter large permease [Pseudomonadota bacterium]
MDWGLILLCSSLVLLVLMLLGVPIAYSLGFLALILGTFMLGDRILFLFGSLAYGKVNSFGLVAVPLFIFMAEMILVSGAAKDAFEALDKWISALPAGLAIASQVACTLFAAVCGASTATTAVIGGMAVPEMINRGYDKRLATGSIAAGGALGVLIPPSILLIIYGIIAEVSIGQLFIAGILPGILLTVLRIAYFMVRVVIDPASAPREQVVSWSARWRALWKILPLVFLAVFMFGALYTGMATPTEVAGVGCFASLIIAAAYRRLSWACVKEAFERTARTTCFIIWILVAASAFGYVLSFLQVPQQLVSWASSLQVSPYVILIAVNLLLFVLGCIMDPAAIIMVTVPMLAPLMHELGFDLVWFGVIFVVNMELAEITPPLGLNLYVMKAVAPPGVTLNDIIIGSVPFMILDVLGLALVIIFPWLVMWLPSTMM